jgi:DNA-binding response OmpR family regulator
VAGKRIFVAEDETLIAMALEDILHELGYELAGSASSLDTAMTILAAPGAIDAAILDIELGDAQSWPVAALLAERDVPFAFSTGHGNDAEIDPRFANAPILDKPYDSLGVSEMLARLLAPS